MKIYDSGRHTQTGGDYVVTLQFPLSGGYDTSYLSIYLGR